LNILHVAEYYFANPDFVKLGKKLAKRGHNLSVVTSIRTVDKPEQVENVKILEIKPCITLYKLPRILTFPFPAIYKIVKRQDVKIVHLLNDLSTNAAFASIISRITDIPFVYTIQGPGTRLNHPLVDTVITVYHHTVERWIVNRAHKVILLSNSLVSAAQELGVEKSRMAVVPSGIDSHRFNSERSEVKEKADFLRNQLEIGDSVVLGFVGRLVPAKGLEVFFSAVKQIQDKHHNITVLIVGDGALRKKLEAIAKELKVRTIFTGWKRDTLAYYSLMDIFVLPSFYEGLANVLLEAMAMKKAVVATKVGGNPDVILNGENGFLVPAGDSKQMASALKQLIEDDNLRARIGKSNRQKVEKSFSWDMTVERIERIYSEVV